MFDLIGIGPAQGILAKLNLVKALSKLRPSHIANKGGGGNSNQTCSRGTVLTRVLWCHHKRHGTYVLISWVDPFPSSAQHYSLSRLPVRTMEQSGLRIVGTSACACCRANSEHIRQAMPDSSLGSQSKVLKIFQVATSSPGSSSANHSRMPAPDRLSSKSV